MGKSVMFCDFWSSVLKVCYNIYFLNERNRKDNDFVQESQNMKHDRFILFTQVKELSLMCEEALTLSFSIDKGFDIQDLVKIFPLLVFYSHHGRLDKILLNVPKYD